MGSCFMLGKRQSVQNVTQMSRRSPKWIIFGQNVVWGKWLKWISDPPVPRSRSGENTKVMEIPWLSMAHPWMKNSQEIHSLPRPQESAESSLGGPPPPLFISHFLPFSKLKKKHKLSAFSCSNLQEFRWIECRVNPFTLIWWAGP